MADESGDRVAAQGMCRRKRDFTRVKPHGFNLEDSKKDP